MNPKLLKTIIIVGIVVAVIVGGVIFGVTLYSDSVGSDKAGKEVVITLSEEDTISTVAEKLGDSGVINVPWFFEFRCTASRGSTVSRGFRTGDITLDTNMSYDEILEAIVTPWYTERETVTITFPEGSEVVDIVNKLISNGIGTEEGFADVIATYGFEKYDFVPAVGTSNRLEGYLYPDTYEFFADSTEIEALSKLLSGFENKIIKDAEVKELIEASDYSFSEILIIASIVEKESGRTDDMPNIASVFLNRLKKNMLLQSCATYNYTVPKADRSSALTAAQLKDDIPYNTYINKGLPPTCIANPGKNAIMSVLKPADTDYLYFCATGDGGTAFAETLAQHQANVNKYKENW